MKLFIPGPTEVAPEILQEMARPAIGHRTPECAELWKSCRAGLAQLMHTSSEVVILTAPASAMMEAAIRNTVKTRSLHLICGAFSKRWADVADSCGVTADRYVVDMGDGFTGDMLRAKLEEASAAGIRYDAVTCVHNETSTGVTNPIDELGAVLRDYPDTLFLVDTVSSMAGMPVLVDDWGIDVCLFGVQKAMALIAGLAVASVSDAALERAATIEHRGWFLDFLRLKKGNEKEQSPTTPSTAHLYAMKRQLERIFEEGLEARWARHSAMAERVRTWAAGHGWKPFPAERFLSATVSCIARGDGPDFVPALNALKAEGMLASNGYGDLKGKTFRIGHLGEHNLDSINALLERFDAHLAAEVQQ